MNQLKSHPATADSFRFKLGFQLFFSAGQPPVSIILSKCWDVQLRSLSLFCHSTVSKKLFNQLILLHLKNLDLGRESGEGFLWSLLVPTQKPPLFL